MSLALELIDKRLAELAPPPEVLAEIEALKAERKRIAALVKDEERQGPTRVETATARDAMNAKIAATAKRRGRKAGAKRDKTIGEKILEYLARDGSSSVEEIADKIGEEKRSVSYTLQNLKRAGKVERNGSFWSIVRPTNATTDDADPIDPETSVEFDAAAE